MTYIDVELKGKYGCFEDCERVWYFEVYNDAILINKVEFFFVNPDETETPLWTTEELGSRGEDNFNCKFSSPISSPKIIRIKATSKNPGGPGYINKPHLGQPNTIRQVSRYKEIYKCEIDQPHGTKYFLWRIGVEDCLKQFIHVEGCNDFKNPRIDIRTPLTNVEIDLLSPTP